MQRRRVIGTRGSALALVQARAVQAALATATGLDARDGEAVEAAWPIEVIKTSGDQVQDRYLADVGGKGLFTKELDEALLDGRIDLAVHSLKDVPAHLPGGVVIAACPPRRDPRDVLIHAEARRLADLPVGARLGTASARRQAQALHVRPDLQMSLLRGNVQTRLDRVAAGAVDATFLARAGLDRLGLNPPHAATLEVDDMLPAVGQGTVAVTARADDAETRAALAAIDHAPTALSAAAERGYLAALDGSCRTPLAGLAELSGDGLRLRVEALTLDGRHCWRRDRETSDLDLEAAAAFGAQLGAEIVAEAGSLLERAV